jgi:hypothetical protein
MLERKLTVPEAESLYDSDFFEWTQSVAEDLRHRQVSDADLEHVAEEIADMGGRDRRELRNRMTVLVMHLMKWAGQPTGRKGGTWRATIDGQRLEIEGIIEQSPSLRNDLLRQLPNVYRKAAKFAVGETGLPLSVFLPPDRLDAGFSDLDRLLSDDFFPGHISDLFR